MSNYRIDSEGRKVWDFGCYSHPITQEFRDKEFEPSDRLSSPLSNEGSFPFFELEDFFKCTHNNKKIRKQCRRCDALDAALGM